MQQCNIRLQFVRCSCHRLRIVSRLQTMRTEVSRLIMKMKMVLTERCGHIIVSHLLKRLKTRKYLLQVQVNNQHLNPFPLPSTQRAGEGVASCYWQSQNHPRLVTSIVLLWASILQPVSVTWNYSVLSVLFCLATWMTTIRFSKSARGQIRTQVYLVFSESYELRAEVEVAGGKCWGRDARTRSCCWRQSSLIVILPWWVLDFG